MYNYKHRDRKNFETPNSFGEKVEQFPCATHSGSKSTDNNITENLHDQLRHYKDVPLPIVMSQTVRREESTSCLLQADDERSHDNNPNSRKRSKLLDVSEEINTMDKGCLRKSDDLLARICSQPISFYDLPHPSKLRKFDCVEPKKLKNYDVERHLREVRSKTQKCYGHISKMSCKQDKCKDSEPQKCSDVRTLIEHSLALQGNKSCVVPGSVQGLCVTRKHETSESTTQSEGMISKGCSLDTPTRFNNGSNVSDNRDTPSVSDLFKQWSSGKLCPSKSLLERDRRACKRKLPSCSINATETPYNDTLNASTLLHVDELPEGRRLSVLQNRLHHMLPFEEPMLSVTSRLSSVTTDDGELGSHLQPFNESFQSFKRMSSSGSELFQDSHIQVLRPRDRCSDQTLSQYHHKNITVSSSNVRENDCNYLECPTDDSYVTMDIQPLTTSSPLDPQPMGDKIKTIWNTRPMQDTYSPVLSPIREQRLSQTLSPVMKHRLLPCPFTEE